MSSPEFEGQLAEALMAVSVLDTLRERRLCVEMATERLRQRLSVPEYDNKKVHLLAMVRVFGSVPRRGWLALTQSVAQLADNDLPSQRAAALADPTVRPATSETAQKELQILLAGLDLAAAPHLVDLYLAAGERFAPSPEDVHSAWDAYQLLDSCNAPPSGAPASLRFLQDLAATLPPEAGDRIRRWVSRHVRTGGYSGERAQEILEASRRSVGSRGARPAQPAHLLIQIFTLTGDPGRVRVTCWANTGPRWEPRQRDERSMQLREVPGHVAALVNREEIRLRDHPGGIVLEFILPVPLINTPVENWERTGAFDTQGDGRDRIGFDAPLGWDYPVVVRSLERIEALQLHRVWNERWGVLSDGVGGRVRRCDPEDGAEKYELYAALKYDPSVVLMALSSPPDDPLGKNQLELALQAGLPALIWGHHEPLTQRAHQAAEEAAGSGRWSELLSHVARLRFDRDARDDRSISTTSRIAILWDDPNRLPEIPDPTEFLS